MKVTATAERDRQIRSEAKGTSYTALGIKYGVSKQRIAQIAGRSGRGRERWPREQTELAQQLRAAGLSFAAIGVRLGKDKGAVWRHLKRVARDELRNRK